MAAWERTNVPQPKLAILTPVGGFVQFLSTLMARNMEMPLPYVWHCTSGYPIDISRDHLVKKALEDKVEYIFFVDTDVIPHPRAISIMLSWQLPIVSGLYWSKARLPCAYQFGKDEIHVDAIDPALIDPKIAKQRLLEVAAVGAGCLLIDARVFKVVPEPWFKWDMVPWIPREEGSGHSEDINFCLKAKKYGFPVYLDSGIRCKHLLEGSYCLDEDGQFSAIL